MIYRLRLHAILLTVLFTSVLLQLSAQEKVNLSGVIKGVPPESIQILKDRFYINTDLEIEEIPVDFSEFEREIPLKEDGLVKLVCAEDTMQLYLAPGMDLHMEFSTGDLPGSAEFSGEGAGPNQFLANFMKAFGDYYDVQQMEQRILNTDNVDKFEIELYSSRNRQYEFAKDYEGYAQFPQPFRAYMDNLIKYNYLRWLLAYPIIRANTSATNLTVPRLPDIMLGAVNHAEVNDPEAFNTEPYRDYLTFYVTYFTSKENDFQKFTDFSQSLTEKYNYARQHLEGKMLVYALTEILLFHCEKASASASNRVLDAIREKDESGVYAKAAEAYCSELIAQAGSGDNKKGKKKNGRDLVLTDLNGKEVALSDFKGKVVYVDIWASWCGPCRKQFPYAKELKGKFNRKQLRDLEFLYISIDNQMGAWQKAVEKFGIEGYHTWSPGGWGSDAARFFGVNSIPRYALINKKGEVVDANAKRPSNMLIYEELLRLIEE